MTYSDAIQYLYDLRWFGAKLGLDNTLRLAALAGNPHHELRFIHVAGTNGKGSTCAMLESIYRAAGLRVGLFTSPHLVAFGERIQVDRQLLKQGEVVRLVTEMQSLLKRFPAEENPTFFEVVTVMALRHFAEQKSDLVIWETGLGGRLDATNIVTPLASVITNIQYDHHEWLGETLASIAGEKAGIIKPGVLVITATDEQEALQVIAKTACTQNAPLTVVEPSAIGRPPLNTIELPLLGRHQRLNAAVAVATVRALAPQIPVSEEAISAGLAGVEWPGRLQVITRPSSQKVLLDGAHNVAGARVLAAALKEYFPSVKPALLLGVLQDKDWAGMCKILAPMAGRILLAPVQSERSATPQALVEVCRHANPSIEVIGCASLGEALRESAKDPFLAIAGSLYLVGEALEVLRPPPVTAADERGLNEWGGPARTVTRTLSSKR
jgi:dihydrofolate synthase/folylpolyglutamate synthase